MDPNETLAKLRVWLNSGIGQDPDETIDLLEEGRALFWGLDSWMRKGGFLPADWDQPGVNRPPF